MCHWNTLLGCETEATHLDRKSSDISLSNSLRGKHCRVCKKKLSRANTSGYCRVCRGRFILHFAGYSAHKMAKPKKHDKIAYAGIAVPLRRHSLYHSQTKSLQKDMRLSLLCSICRASFKFIFTRRLQGVCQMIKPRNIEFSVFLFLRLFFVSSVFLERDKLAVHEFRWLPLSLMLFDSI